MFAQQIVVIVLFSTAVIGWFILDCFVSRADAKPSEETVEPKKMETIPKLEQLQDDTALNVELDEHDEQENK